MKTLKEFTIQINEVLKASDPIEKWIDDFVHSKNPKFAGKSTKERIEMAKGAYYGAQKNESASISQNSTAEVDMNEERDVHVNDGSKYDEEPHPKDVEHVMAGVKKYGGKHAGNSDKGVYFRFKSKDEADSFRAHVNKCPHKSCDADHVTEAVEYKGIGTDVVDKKKVLNPPIPLTQKKKEVKDFKEEAEELDELDKKTIGSYAKKATKDLKWQQTMRPFDTKRIQNREKGIDAAIDKLTKEEVKKSTGDLKKACWKGYTAVGLKMKDGRKVPNCVPEEVQIDELSKTTLQSYRDKAAKDVGRAYAIHQDPYKKTDKDDMRKLSNRVKGDERAEIGLKKEEVEQIDEVSKSTLVSYIDKASQDVHDKAMAAGSHHAGKSYKDFMANYAKSGKRQAGITKAAVKLAKEEVEQIEEATVASRKYDFGTMKTIHHGKSFSIPLHPEHHQPIAKLKHGESHSFKDETGAKWKATRDNDTVHFHGGSYGTQKTSVPHSSLQESRGHKVLATFFKNREVAQRAFQGNPAKDAEVAQGGGTPADQGIAAAKKDAEKLKKESVNPALMAILKKRQEAQKKKEEDKKKVNEAKAGVSAKAPSVATPKTTKSSTKGYVSAAIPGTKRVTRAIPDNNEVGGGEGNQIKEDQYAADYKIKYYVDPITGENKTRKIRPHRVNFANSKMRAEPAQADARGDYGSWKEEV